MNLLIWHLEQRQDPAYEQLAVAKNGLCLFVDADGDKNLAGLALNDMSVLSLPALFSGAAESAARD